jgi:hypothetical protein
LWFQALLVSALALSLYWFADSSVGNYKTELPV